MSGIPKLYRVVEIEFSSLRNGIGSSMGVIFDIDTMVKRKARRVIGGEGWKWQLFNYESLLEYDWFAETDVEILDEIGMDMSFVRVINPGGENEGGNAKSIGLVQRHRRILVGP